MKAPGFGLVEASSCQQVTAKHVVSIPLIPSNGRDQVQNRYSDSFGGGVRSSSPSYTPRNDLQASVRVPPSQRICDVPHDDVYRRAVAQSHGLACNDGAIRFGLRCSRSRLTS